MHATEAPPTISSRKLVFSDGMVNNFSSHIQLFCLAFSCVLFRHYASTSKCLVSSTEYKGHLQLKLNGK